MSFIFDEEFDRTGTNSIKWNFNFDNGDAIPSDRCHPKWGDERVLPMFVADMDFRAPHQVIEALVKRAAHGVFGYSMPDDCYYEAVLNWFSRRYAWNIEREWIVVTPGIVPTLNMLVQQFTDPGDRVLVQRPVYHPFTYAIERNGRSVVSNSLVQQNGRYQMDFADLAEKTTDPALKLAILCSPHNPVGRVWSQEELIQFGQICEKNDVLVVSDEIHCDLIMDGVTFQPYATAQSSFAQNSIICTAPSKTFNVAGLKTSNIIIANPALREGMQEAIARNGLYGKNAFGLVAAEAAYRYGDRWLDAVNAYVYENYKYMVGFIHANLPQLTVTPLEGTYLAWVDFSALGLDQAVLNKMISEDARLALNDGAMFGPEGEGFMRFNLACHRPILVEALKRLKTAVSNIT